MNLAVAFLVLAFLAIVAGVLLVYVPAGFIVAGVLLAVVGVGMIERPGGERE